MLYMTISSQENHHFSLCSYFHAHPTTLLLKILGGTNAWAVPPPQILGGPSPSPPLGLRPCIDTPWILIHAVSQQTFTKCKLNETLWNNERSCHTITQGH